MLFTCGLCVNFSQFANYESNTFPESVLTGGMATFDVYSFTNLMENQTVVSAIWVTNEQGHDYSSTNVAVAGWEVSQFLFINALLVRKFHASQRWHDFISRICFSFLLNSMQVNPSRYDDTKTHFFTQWTVLTLPHVWLSEKLHRYRFREILLHTNRLMGIILLDARTWNVMVLCQ